MREQTLWVEKYRPQTIDECILPPRLKDFFQAQVDKGELQNMLLIGGAGTGKTTAAKALCRELGIDVLFINASESGGIDTIRVEIRSFASTISFAEGKTKCVILDEADHLSFAAQPALRAFIEEFSSNCRFILTANYANRIIDPIKSRCAVIDFVMNKEEKAASILAFNKRARAILEGEGIVFDKKDLAEVVMKYFPDYRKILNELQRHSHSGELKVSALAGVGDEAIKQVMRFVKEKKFGEYRKWVAQNADIDFSTLVRAIYDRMGEFIESQDIPELVIILSEYDYKRAFVVDVEILTTAMLTQIMGSIKFK
jgi:DNA polymerase III delta prime subunit